MGSGSFATRLRRSAAFGTIIAAMSLPAFGQTPPTPNPDTVDQIKPAQEAAPKADVVVITGTRLQSQFTSASPITRRNSAPTVA